MVESEGQALESLRGRMYRVRLEKLSPYDPTRGRISFRLYTG